MEVDRFCKDCNILVCKVYNVVVGMAYRADMAYLACKVFHRKRLCSKAYMAQIDMAMVRTAFCTPLVCMAMDDRQSFYILKVDRLEVHRELNRVLRMVGAWKVAASILTLAHS